MLYERLLADLVYLPFYGVPIALVAWAIFQIAVRKALGKALIGLLLGGAACAGAFLLFFGSIYCEHCAGKPLELRHVVAITTYFAFGVAMLVLLFWTARQRKSTTTTPTVAFEDRD